MDSSIIFIIVVALLLVGFFIYRRSLAVYSRELEEHSKLKLEEVILETADKRQAHNKLADELIEKHGSIVSHEELMAKLGVK